ncbi:MAG: putative sugar nucleotidyl transferase [Crocinitomicaceae bacterium]|nr:glucose-1-phosphate thymidylyltransferase [Crocinitomicaceae bacterium]
MNIILDDNGHHYKLAPLTLTRPVAALRIGIETIAESWERLLKQHIEIKSVEYRTEDYLNAKFPEETHLGLIIAGNIKPTPAVAKLVAELPQGDELFINGKWVADHGIAARHKVETTLPEEEFIYIENPWDLFQQNHNAILHDFNLITSGRTTQHLSSSNQVIGSHPIFLEEGAKVECCILNAESGPIYIGKDAEIMEGSIIRGPFVLCEHSTIKMGAKMYGDTTIGPYCKVGGEVTNSIFQAYSNKGHDGFVGNSVIGEWCNLGADTNTSNLKNNYSNVRVYSYETRTMIETDVMFCGVIMGDHAKTGINTMLNTATSVGICANIFGGGFPSKYVAPFTWGGVLSNDKFELDKCYEVAENMMKRRGITLTEDDKFILKYLHDELA